MLLLSSFLLSSRSLACAVCGVYGDDVSSKPFLQGTALLSLTPLIFMGGVAFYVHRRLKQARATESAPLGAPQASPLSLQPSPPLLQSSALSPPLAVFQPQASTILATPDSL